MSRFTEIKNLLTSPLSGLERPKRDILIANGEYGPRKWDEFIEEMISKKNIPKSSSPEDTVRVFQRTEITSCWKVARLNLSAFNAGLDVIRHTPSCLWFEGIEAPPEALAWQGVVLDCKPNRGDSSLNLTLGQKVVGTAHPMLGWDGNAVAVIGWLAMIDTTKCSKDLKVAPPQSAHSTSRKNSPPSQVV
jgi:hypothetical protein